MKTYSLHKITEENKFPFSATKYSRFKFGDKNIAREFGFALAKGFIANLDKDFPIWGEPPGDQIVVISSPYSFIPTATFAMKDYFIQRLNEYLVDNNAKVVQECRIYRTTTYREDYGALSGKERLKLISGDSFYIDKQFVKGKVCIYLDDIKITGSHEIMVKRMIKEQGISARSIFIYFAELINDSINPNVENTLNYHFVKDLLCVNKIIRDGEFLPNTRVIKYILSAPPEQSIPFIDYQPLKLLSNIYHLAIGNSYHLICTYHKNLTYIKKILSQNKLL